MIEYKKGYKYQLSAEHVFILPKEFPRSTNHEGVFLSVKGRVVTIKAGYAWDGPSGPTIDTKNFMEGSLEHDAIYQLMREGVLDRGLRKFADIRLEQTCKKDGMSWARRKWVYAGVRLGAAKAAKKKSLRKTLFAGKL